ncbi:outer membrane lipid asymmetry maintenance protein MlaD [Anaplasma capra]|uniref:outer membrane lipid asymmetry maintenance protein MlaD n=1 Tax=Anaplasma capra TaxID=1562740 RepID=UPI0021D5EC5A|nr:outer membrane lipid asymmetry maintenance protein MlaD [Anaplasma capra]MCU7611260.1 outer membrane lipid asymmetry maintenance protein MlaD [Anaplasma capra]MCU7612687.1 outer membrane lipid asymmetry maintenance protein MlaD [Anaplasma capra]
MALRVVLCFLMFSLCGAPRDSGCLLVYKFSEFEWSCGECYMSQYSITEVLVGVLVSAAVVAMGVYMANRLPRELRFYKGCYTVHAHFADVDGLKVGSEVRISGVNVGSVTSMYLDQDNMPVVKMCIQKGLRLPVDSSATVTYADLLGRKYVDIMPGSDEVIITEGGPLRHTSTAATLRMILEGVMSSVLGK